MSENLNQKIAQLTGLTSSFISEIKNNAELKESEKYFLYRDLVQAVAIAEKQMSSIDKRLIEYAKKSMENGDVKFFEGYELTIQINKSSMKLDIVKLEKDFERMLGDYNLEYKKSDYEIPRTPSTVVKIEKPLNYNQ